MVSLKRTEGGSPRIDIPRKQIVYIVENGEKYEGGYVVSIHKTFEGAVKAALQVRACFEGGWVKDLMDEEPGKFCSWENGCDWLSVRKMEVEE